MSDLHRLRPAVRAALALATAFAAAGASAQTVITNSGFTATAADVHDIYVGDKQYAGSTRVVAVDNASAQKAFLEHVLKLEPGKYNSIWAKKSFREGLNAPLTKSTDSEVVDFVKKTPGAIGYIGDASKAVGVNVVK